MPVFKDKERNTFFVKLYYTDWTGKRRQKLKRGFKLQRDAKEWERDFLERQQGAPTMTFQTLTEMYMEDIRHRLKESTIKTNSGAINTHILPYFQNQPINEITPADVRAWQNQILKLSHSDSYTNLINNLLSGIFNYAVRYCNLSRNPCRVCGSIGKANVRRLDFSTMEEFNYMLSHVKNPVYHVIFLMLFYGGMRIGELQALTLEDFDPSAGTVCINKTYYRLHQKDYITTPKTENSNRTVMLPRFVADELSSYIARLYDISAKDRLFTASYQKIRYALNIACKQADMKPMRIHSLRHSHVSMLIDMGFPPIQIAERIGDTVTMVNTVYGHLYPSRRSEIADWLNDHVLGNTK